MLALIWGKCRGASLTPLQFLSEGFGVEMESAMTETDRRVDFDNRSQSLK